MISKWGDAADGSRLCGVAGEQAVRPARVRENWRRLMAKCVLRGTGQETKAACGTEQMAGGVEAGIEGGIHAM